MKVVVGVCFGMMVPVLFLSGILFDPRVFLIFYMLMLSGIMYGLGTVAYELYKEAGKPPEAESKRG